MVSITAASLLAFLAGVGSLGSLLYVGQLRARFPLLQAVVIAFTLHHLLWGVILLQGELAALADARLRFILFGLRCFAIVALVAYAIENVKLTAGRLLVWSYGVGGLVLVVATFIGFGDVEASFEGGMPISSALKGFRRLFLVSGIALFALAMLRGLSAADLAVRQRSRATLRSLLPVALFYVLHIILRSFNVALLGDAVLLSLLPLMICVVLWVLVLEEAGLLSPLRIKLEVLFRILIHKGSIDAATLNDCLEQAMVLSALRRSENNKAEAARLLGLSKSTFHRKASRYLNQPEIESAK